MSYDQPQPSRDHSQKRMVDIVRIGHDTLLTEHELLQKAVLGINNFQAVPSDPDADNPKVYQYQIENQEIYQQYEILLVSATATFLPVITQYKAELFKLEMQVPQTEYDIEYADAQTKTEEPQTLRDKLGLGQKKKRVITKNDPYQHGLPYLTESLTKVERLERFGEMQNYGIDLADHVSYTGMINYLKMHRTRFKFEIAPTIIRMHRQYIDLVLKEEKVGAVRIVAKLDDEWYKTRLDESKMGMSG